MPSEGGSSTSTVVSPYGGYGPGQPKGFCTGSVWRLHGIRYVSGVRAPRGAARPARPTLDPCLAVTSVSPAQPRPPCGPPCAHCVPSSTCPRASRPRCSPRPSGHPGPPSAYDATDIPLFTIDPPTSTDLDQAMHLSRRPGRLPRPVRHRRRRRVRRTRRRPGRRGPPPRDDPLLPGREDPPAPARLSEGAASLLPDQTCPAVLWTIDLDADGRTDGHRRTPRPRPQPRQARLRVRAEADRRGTAEEPLALLKDIGLLREQLEVERGGISLNVPEQEIVETRRTRTNSPTAPRSPPTAGTRRSPCSPGWPRPI